MKREIITTVDGSKTIQISDWNEQYHSKHGAIQESRHVFLDMGLSHYISKTAKPLTEAIDILEMGFGTGLNALLTLHASIKMHREIRYSALEAYPISKAEVAAMQYPQLIDLPEAASLFEEMHQEDWEQWQVLHQKFQLYKHQIHIEKFSQINAFDIVYFDAFGARVQPELWTEDIFEKMFAALRENGILVTYAAKGSVRRAMQAVGFVVERLPGPPGKREMLRATKSPLAL